MSVLQSSWRHSLAATALVALLAPISGDTMAQEAREKEVPTLFAGERPADEARRERESPEAREPERAERDRGEREGGEREALMHQVEVLRLAADALREAKRGDAVEMVERAIRAREVMLEGRRDEEAQKIREQAPGPADLAEILGMAAGLWRESGNPDKAAAVAELAEALRAPRDRGPERREREREREGRQRRPPGERDERLQQLKREWEELKEKAQRIEAQLRERPGDEAARELEGAAREVRERMGDIERQIAELTADRQRREMEERERGQRERGEREREELQRRLDELMAAHARAREAGRPEEAERLLREAEEIKQRLAGRPEREMPPPEEREEMERRMQHVRAAIENLHAAGLHEQAEQLAREMERMLQRPPGPPRPEEPRPRGEGPPPEHIENALRELHEAVRNLNQRLDEMNRNVEREIQAIRRDMEAMGRPHEEAKER